MKIFLFTILLAALTASLARAQCTGYSACAHNNSKACVDARNAFARHHNGLYPEQWCNEWYQGQQGRWNQRGNHWQWEGAEGDQWFQGRRGHWFKERDAWQFRGDKGDEYRNGHNGWQWSGARSKHHRE